MSRLTLQVPPLPRERFPALDELKGVAILLVVLYHAGGVLTWNNYLHGDLGVDLFIILSGFGLVLGDKPEATCGVFLRRRLLRLMPAYWPILTLFLLLNTHFLQHSYGWGNILLHFTGLHGLGGDQYALAVNDSFWFVTLILFAYGCFWCFRNLLDRPALFLFWSALLCASLALLLFFTNQSALLGHAGYRLPGFFLGMLAGHLLKTGKLELSLNFQCGAALVVFAYVPYTRGIFFHPPLAGGALIAGYVCWARPWLAPHAPWVTGGLALLGRYSLEIFLIHQPLIRDYNYYLHGRWLNESQPSAPSLIVGMAIGLVVTLLLSVELRRWLGRVPSLASQSSA